MINLTVDIQGINLKSPIPVMRGLYDLTPDELLLSQEYYESEVRSYPRRLPLAIAKASGVLVEDTRGQVYLDCLAGAGTIALGYNHPEINQALIEQLNSGIPYQTLDITTPAKDHFIRELMAFLPHTFAENAKVQFCGPSGADAVEAAIKLAKQTTSRNTIAAFHGAYHGMTNGTMAMMGNLGTKSRRQGLMADVHFLPFPYDLRCPFGLHGEQGARQGLRYIERMLADDECGIQTPAAIIVEPIQGEGGVIPAPVFWLKELRRITEEYGILLIFDEIQCGIGKTGAHFAFEESGVTPDILCLSKAIGGGLPMSLLVFNKRIDTWRPGEHTGTFRGNQLAMVSGAKTMEIIRRDNLAQQVKITGEYFRHGLEKIATKTRCIAEVRGKGLMLGVEICDPEGSKNKFFEPLSAPELTLSIQRAALERGLIIEKGGREGSVLRFLPPLTISFEQIDFALKALQNAIDSLVKPKQFSQSPDTLQQNWRDHFIHTGNSGADSFEIAMNQSTQALKKIFEHTDTPYSGIDPTVLAAQIRHANLGKSPQPLSNVIEETQKLIGENSIIVQHPHCIAHLHTPPLLPAVAAESFITALNQSMDSWDQASAGTFVEQEVTDWLCRSFGFSDTADGVFTSGGTQSNLMGLLIARDHVVKVRSDCNVQKEGLPNYASKLRVICSNNTHFSMKKSAALLGLGENAVVCVNTYSDGSMDVESAEVMLKALEADGLIPFMIIGTVGTTDHGAIDNLDDVANFAEKHDLWMHVDAAYGGALMLSRHQARLEGIKRADSVTVDFHKMFFQPISCGAVILKDKIHFSYIRHHSDYLNREDDILPNLVDKSIATTRRFDALKLWMTLQNIGSKTLGSMIDYLLNLTQLVADMVNNRLQFELLVAPCLSTVLFRYVGVENGYDLDYLNRQIRLDALVKGRAVVGETTVDGKVALKFTLLNPCLRLSDFDQLLNELESLADDAVKQIQN
ncbi:pyridoxal phosphate-dependent class III aminotransferase [Candidatus Enterovibrio escicola]|uniref:pyridoxal phosphate-dependent class III aminotransferase n=1 Tax=Candidatus Enterovibrio escicola TaxID=1927127 RepID=UPI0012381634|nr:pyridoxal phosphate-dependent class III aminotransferase [Candidatus Enterovibrio escacola]